MMTLQERLRRLYVQQGTNYVQEAADRIDALEAELADTLEKLKRFESFPAPTFMLIKKVDGTYEKRDLTSQDGLKGEQ